MIDIREIDNIAALVSHGKAAYEEGLAAEQRKEELKRQKIMDAVRHLMGDTLVEFVEFSRLDAEFLGNWLQLNIPGTALIEFGVLLDNTPDGRKEKIRYERHANSQRFFHVIDGDGKLADFDDLGQAIGYAALVYERQQDQETIEMLQAARQSWIREKRDRPDRARWQTAALRTTCNRILNALEIARHGDTATVTFTQLTKEEQQQATADAKGILYTYNETKWNHGFQGFGQAMRLALVQFMLSVLDEDDLPF